MGEKFYHEPDLPEDARDTHRALASLIEELEAVDWYNQRMAVTGDDELKSVLLHNRDEEIEHAAMVLEYLRRKISKFDEELKTYLFTDRPIAEVEEEAEGAEHAEMREEAETEPSVGSLGLKNIGKGT